MDRVFLSRKQTGDVNRQAHTRREARRRRAPYLANRLCSPGSAKLGLLRPHTHSIREMLTAPGGFVGQLEHHLVHDRVGQGDFDRCPTAEAKSATGRG